MHWFAIVFGVHLATVLGIVAFFVLFAASKAEGFVALLGKLLGYWVLLGAVLALACGIYSGVTGKPLGPMGDGGPRMMHHWGDGPMMQPPPPAGSPAPAPNKT